MSIRNERSGSVVMVSALQARTSRFALNTGTARFTCFRRATRSTATCAPRNTLTRTGMHTWYLSCSFFFGPFCWHVRAHMYACARTHECAASGDGICVVLVPLHCAVRPVVKSAVLIVLCPQTEKITPRSQVRSDDCLKFQW